MSEFIMAGTEGSKEYTVVAKNVAGRLGVRALGEESVRIRIEHDEDFTEELEDRLEGEWNQPNGQKRFSRVVEAGDAARAAVRQALEVLRYLGGPLEINPVSAFFEVAQDLGAAVAPPMAPPKAPVEENPFADFRGTEGTLSYRVAAIASHVKIGVRTLDPGQYRVRVVPRGLGFPPDLYEAFQNWKFPEEGNVRFSQVGGESVVREAMQKVRDQAGAIQYNSDSPFYGLLTKPVAAPVSACAPVKSSAAEALAKAATSLAAVASDIAKIAATL